jgi:hypothetical protein
VMSEPASQPASEPASRPVSRDLAARLSRAMVGCYPPRWKQRYRDEILDVLDQHQPSPRTVLSLAGGALVSHLDPDYRMEHPVIPPTFRTAVKGIAQITGVTMAGLGLLVGLFIVTHLQGFVPDVIHWVPNPTAGANALSVTPDQRLLAIEVGGEPTSAVVTLYAVGHTALRQLSSFEGGVTVAMAPDGKLVATSAYRGMPALWNVARPRHPARLAVLPAGSSNALWGAAFSPDSRLLAFAYGSTVALWDVARPARPHLLNVLDFHVGKVLNADIAFSPDGHLLAAASGSGQITIWNVARPRHAAPVATISPPKGAGWLGALAFSPAGPLLAGVTSSGTVLVYNLARPAHPVRTALLRSLAPLALFPDGASGATSAVPTGCPGCGVPDFALGFAPGGHALALVMSRGAPPATIARDTVLTWQVTASGALRDRAEAYRNIYDGQPALAPDGRTVIDGQIFGGTTVRLWQVPAAPGET